MTTIPDAGEGPKSFARFSWIYGFAHFGKSLFWHGSELLFAFYLTEICGVAATWMAAVLTVSTLAGALADIAVGTVLGRRVTGMRSALTMQRLAAVASGGAIMLFAAIAILDAHWRLPAALVTLLLFRVTYAWLDVPQNALIAFAAHDDTDRTRLASVRYIGSGLAAVVIGLTFALLLENQVRSVQAVHFAILGLSWTAIALAGAFTLAAVSTVATAPVSCSPRGAAVHTSGYALGGLLVAMFIFTLWSSLFNKLQAYVQAPTDMEGKAAGALLIATAVGTMAGQPLWTGLARRRSISAVLNWSAAALALVGIAFVPLMWVGAGGIALGGLFYGIAWGGVAMALWALMAGVGPRWKGIGVTTAMGFFTFSAKLGSAAAALLLGQVLARSGHAADDGGSILALVAALPVCAAVCVVLAIQSPRKALRRVRHRIGA